MARAVHEGELDEGVLGGEGGGWGEVEGGEAEVEGDPARIDFEGPCRERTWTGGY